MRKILTIIFSFFLITLIIGSLNNDREVNEAKKVFAQEGPGGPPCPHFFVEDGDDVDAEFDHVPTTPFESECHLHRDVIGLVEPLTLESGIKLNCQGHTITPTHPGTGIPNNVNPRSQPEVAIFLNGGNNVNGVHNVQIQNCIIDGFDFGIFAINSKIPEELKDDPGALALHRNKILRNTINVRFTPISLISFDNTEIKENTMTVTTIGGIGLYVGRNRQ